MNPTYPLFPVLALCGSLLVLIPLPWHVQAWNVGTCAYIFWASMACLFEFINSLVWNGNTLNPAPVWCDISSKFLLGAGVGIPAAGLCISRRLYTITAIKSTIVTSQDKRRAVVIDSCVAFGIPIIVMALHYIVQTNRFNILEDVGCWPATYNTPPAYFLVFMWPGVLGCISFVYSSLTLCAFYKRRLEFAQFLSAYSSFSMSRYIRLMLLAVSEILCTIPISIISAYFATKDIPIQPWVSWADTHYDFSFVGQIPAEEWIDDPNFRLSVELTRWLFPAAAFWFFLLFGFGSEARKHYRAAALRVAKVFGYKPASEMPIHAPRKLKADLNKTIPVGSSPIYVPTPAHVKPTKLSVPSAMKSSDVDLEKAGQLSPTVTSASGDSSESEHAVADAAPVADRSIVNIVPAYHLPFRLPNLYRSSNRSQRMSRSLTRSSIRISVQTLVQTQHSTI